MPEVHPRSRGEYSCGYYFSLWIKGSPPLTRGILHLILLFWINSRFTPAHAGNTKESQSSDMLV